MIEIFPGAKDHIHFKFLEDILLNDEVSGEIESLSKKIANIISEGDKDILITNAERHSVNKKSHLLYLAGNLFYNGGTEKYPFSDMAPSTIIPIGGKSEKVFFETLLKKQLSTRKIFPLMTQIGSFPTYYGHKKGDVFSSEEFRHFRENNLLIGHVDIAKDLNLLSNYI